MEPWQKARDARPVVGAGPGSGRDRPRPGDERRAGIGSQGRAPRRDVRHRQTGEGARAAGPASWDAGSRRGAPGPAARGRHRLRAHGQRLVRLHGVRRRRARPRDRRPGVRRRHGHQGGGWCRGRRNRRYHGPPRMAAWTVSRTVPAMARGASASCTPPGSGNAACLPPGRRRRVLVIVATPDLPQGGSGDEKPSS